MKRLILTAMLALAIISGAYSQNIDDALRYSQNFYSGTARTMAMGNAFTSLGADLSAISLNPAGTGMFRTLEISFTPQLYYNNTSSVFNASKATDYKYSFMMPQIGIAGNLISHENSSGLVALNFAYSYNQLSNYYQNHTISGISENSSMADSWVGIANGTYYKNLAGAAGIARDTWVLDTITGSGGASYGSIFSHYGDSTYSRYGQRITREITEEGYKGEHAFSLGANLANKLYIGATFGIIPFRYISHIEHTENDVNNVIYDFKNFTYTDHLEATGTGYSFKVGAIVRPIDMLRIGFAFHAPIGYRVHEYYYDNIASNFDNGDKYSSSNDPLRYDYTLTTPMRILGGVSVQLGKLAILSADYEYTDYSQARFSRASDGYDYYNENQSIKDNLGTSSNLRFGAEFRLGTVYLRGGYSLYGSAFTKNTVNENLNYNAISGGVGFRQSNFYFDFAYSNFFYTEKYYMYYDPGYLQPADLKSSRSTFTATIGMKF